MSGGEDALAPRENRLHDAQERRNHSGMAADTVDHRVRAATGPAPAIPHPPDWTLAFLASALPCKQYLTCTAGV